VDVEASYRRLGLSGIYDRGYAYPRQRIGNKLIYLESRLVEVFRYLANLFLKPLGVSVLRILIELRRPEVGALLYKLCVDLEGADKKSKESAWVIANFAVRILAEVNTAAEPAKVRKAARELVAALEPIEPLDKSPNELQWVMDGRDFRTIPYLNLQTSEPFAEEVKPHREGIRAAMYSRLMGQPGELYYLCADEDWYHFNVQLPQALRMQSKIRMLGTHDAVRSAAGRTLAGVSSAVGISASEFLRIAPQLPFVVSARVMKWVSDHPVATVIIIGVTVVVTAALILSAGTAAPVVLPASEAAIGTLVGAETVAVGAPAMVAPVMAASAPELATMSAVPVVTAAETAPTLPTFLAMARNLAASGVSASELTAARATAAADEVLIKALLHPSVQAGVREAAKAILPMGVAAIGLTPSSAYASTGPAQGKVSAPAMNDADSIHLATGRLLLLKVLQPQQYRPPNTYDQFNGDLYVDRGAEGLNPDRRKIGDLRMLGWFKVV
jgi:hypothetical protein